MHARVLDTAASVGVCVLQLKRRAAFVAPESLWLQNTPATAAATTPKAFVQLRGRSVADARWTFLSAGIGLLYRVARTFFFSFPSPAYPIYQV